MEFKAACKEWQRSCIRYTVDIIFLPEVFKKQTFNFIVKMSDCRMLSLLSLHGKDGVKKSSTNGMKLT
jgi:Tfp pilus assembly ATPase PilU